MFWDPIINIVVHRNKFTLVKGIVDPKKLFILFYLLIRWRETKRTSKSNPITSLVALSILCVLRRSCQHLSLKASWCTETGITLTASSICWLVNSAKCVLCSWGSQQLFPIYLNQCYEASSHARLLQTRWKPVCANRPPAAACVPVWVFFSDAWRGFVN